MKVSIVVPTYNQGPFIEDCLSSIQKQTYQKLEVIIQDSLSTDQTEEICRAYVRRDCRFHYFREKDTGQSDAINRGLARCTGEIWTWICSDDYYAGFESLSAVLGRLNALQLQENRVVGVFGDAQYVTQDGYFINLYYNQTRDLTVEDFKMTWPLAQPSAFLFREAVVQAGGVDPKLYLGMDLDLFLKILKDGRKLVYVPQMVVNIRIQPNSKSVKLRRKTAENALTIVKKHFGDYGVPLESAYVKEFAIAKRLEVTEKIRNALWLFFPFRNVVKALISDLKHRAHLYMDPKCKEKGLGIFLFRFVWGSYQRVKWYGFYPIKRRVVGCIELIMRSKGVVIK